MTGAAVFSQDAIPQMATGTVPTNNTIIKGATQVPPIEPVEVDYTKLIDNIKLAYAGDDNYSCIFTLAVDAPKKTTSEKRIEELTNVYKLMYINTDPDPDSYMLRLEAIQGINRRTTVVYSAINETDYGYTVYKPAIPKGIVLKADDPLVFDVPFTRFSSFISLLEDFVREGSKAEVSALFNVKKNIFELEAIREVPGPRNGTGYEKNVIIVDPENFEIISWELYMKYKETETYKFRSRMTWSDYVTGNVKPDDITEMPDFKN